MAKEKRQALPPRKEPGLISRLFGRVVGLFLWLTVSLMISIAFEWIGIALVWPEQGANHAKIMLEKEYSYLNQRLLEDSHSLSRNIYTKTQTINQWIVNDSGISNVISWAASASQSDDSTFKRWIHHIYQDFQDYIIAVPYVMQVFFVRIAVILFSLPAFLLLAVVGAVDGLVERDLRRWGGGRESSNVYNLARKSVFPVFIIACVMYISLPISIHPAWVIMPFALLFAYSIKVTFERLKKYF